MNEKHWTREFVAALWHNGGFESIAELHNRQLEQLAFQMPLRAVDVELFDQSVCRAPSPTPNDNEKMRKLPSAA
jgi:hypothetical protein